MILEGIKGWAMLALAALCVALALSTCAYRKQYKAADFALTTQNAAIKAQNDQARDRLAALTTERDELQASLNNAAQAAKEKTSAFDKELERLRSAAAKPGPIRVRLQSCDAGRGGRSAAAAIPGAAPAGAGAPTEASGVLSTASAGQLERTLIEVEELSLDFNSCQDSLLALVAAEKR